MEYIHYIFYQSFKRRTKRGARARASLPPLCQSVHCPSGGKTKPPSVFLALSHTQVYTHLSAPFITSGGFQAHVSSDLPPESASRVRWAASSPLRGRRARGKVGTTPGPEASWAAPSCRSSRSHFRPLRAASETGPALRLLAALSAE